MPAKSTPDTAAPADPAAAPPAAAPAPAPSMEGVAIASAKGIVTHKTPLGVELTITTR